MKIYTWFHLSDDDLITEEQLVNFAPNEDVATDLPPGIGIISYFNIIMCLSSDD
jgi:hypothetical protein